MFAVKFYIFSKKENSTKLPTGTPQSYNCLLKDSCSVSRPVLELHDEGSTVGTGNAAWNPTAYNYCYIAEFQRYYFISDWEWIKPFWTCHLTVDVLASFKSVITASTKYVLRSASSDNPEVIDTAYSPTSVKSTSKQVTTLQGWSWAPSDGTYVIGVVSGGNAPSINGITYYVLNQTTLQALLDVMYANVTSMNWTDVVDWNAVISKSFVDPMDYIVTAIWFPFHMYGSVQTYNIRFGFWNTQVSASVLTGTIYNVTGSFANPTNPYVNSQDLRGDWMYLPPFAKYEVIANPFGIIPLNNMMAFNAGGISWKMRIDLTTGIAIFSIQEYIVEGDTPLINQQTAMLGLPIPIGRQRDNVLAILSDVGLMAASGSVLANTTGAIKAATAMASFSGASVKTIGDILSQDAGFIGKTSSVAGNSNEIIYQVTYVKPQDENRTDLGRPLCAEKQLSTLSGYTMCSDGEVTGTGDIMYDEERREVANHLTNGFYIE